MEEHKALMQAWKDKLKQDEKERFIEDGIVDYETWIKQELKILFLLKEAYGDGEFNLAEMLKDGPFETTWKPVGFLINTLLKTTSTVIPSFNEVKAGKDDSEILKRIATINIKKADGNSSSERDNIKEHAQNYHSFLKRQIELIQPDIIICGGTKEVLDEVDFWKDYKEVEGTDDRVFENGNNVLVDFWHPSYRVPDVMKHYTLAGIYQKFLQQKQL